MYLCIYRSQFNDGGGASSSSSDGGGGAFAALISFSSDGGGGAFSFSDSTGGSYSAFSCFLPLMAVMLLLLLLPLMTLLPVLVLVVLKIMAVVFGAARVSCQRWSDRQGGAAHSPPMIPRVFGVARVSQSGPVSQGKCYALTLPRSEGWWWWSVHLVLVGWVTLVVKAKLGHWEG